MEGLDELSVPGNQTKVPRSRESSSGSIESNYSEGIIAGHFNKLMRNQYPIKRLIDLQNSSHITSPTKQKDILLQGESSTTTTMMNSTPVNLNQRQHIALNKVKSIGPKLDSLINSEMN